MSSPADSSSASLRKGGGGGGGSATATTTTTTVMTAGGGLSLPVGSGDALSPPPSRGVPPGLLAAHHSQQNASMQYLQRLLDFRQMDFQSAFDQMKSLLGTRPQVVYKTSYYRKQTKNHWARDDPAFVALQGIFLVLAVLAYSVAFRISLMGMISFLLYTILWNWLGMGFVLASLCREIANRSLTVHQSSSHVKQQVEWLYAFDIHCNSFLPVFVLLCKFN